MDFRNLKSEFSFSLSFFKFRFLLKISNKIKIQILKRQIFNIFEEFSVSIFFEIEMSLAYTHCWQNSGLEIDGRTDVQPLGFLCVHEKSEGWVTIFS